jgi:hypothetical protein
MIDESAELVALSMVLGKIGSVCSCGFQATGSTIDKATGSTIDKGTPHCDRCPRYVFPCPLLPGECPWGRYSYAHPQFRIHEHTESRLARPDEDWRPFAHEKLARRFNALLRGE